MRLLLFAVALFHLLGPQIGIIVVQSKSISQLSSSRWLDSSASAVDIISFDGFGRRLLQAPSDDAQTENPLESWISISAGVTHTCGVTINGGGYCWGTNEYGELGTGTLTDQPSPVEIGLGGVTWGAVSPGWSHTCGITANKAAYCWGDNNDGELGDGSVTIYQSDPMEVANAQYEWSSISAGRSHSCGITTDGSGYCWGENNNGQLGTGNLEGQILPAEVASGQYEWAVLTTGIDHTCGITTDGSGYCWGINDQGQVGDGTVKNRDSPVEIASGEYKWASISAGTDHTCGITEDGAGYCWGRNSYGRLGDGTDNAQTLPVEIASGQYEWTSISAGGAHTCGITTGGDGYCWGRNSYGRLGDGTEIDRILPVEIASGQYDWASISAGDMYTCGVTTSGSGYCWGRNNYGQIGDGTEAETSLPTSVMLLASVDSGDKTTAPVDAPTSTAETVTTLEEQTDSQPESSGGGGVNAAVIGGVVGGVAAIVIVALIGFCLWRRKKNKESEEEKEDEAAHWTLYQGSKMGNSELKLKDSVDDSVNVATAAPESEAAEKVVETDSVLPGQLASHFFSDLATGQQSHVSENSIKSDKVSSSGKLTSNLSSNLTGKRSYLSEASDFLKTFKKSDFDIGTCIGMGSYGRVYKASWRRTDVALKVLGDKHGDLNLSDEDVEALGQELVEEASLMAELRHPNIVQFLGICISPPCLVTEFCCRGSLTALLRQAKTKPEKAIELTWSRRLGVLADAARGMLYLHSNTPFAVLHRDLKSPNILVSDSWTAKVADFGLSRVLEEYHSRSTTGGVASNPRWLAPEVLGGETFTASADVFSFGVVMWEVLSCDLPWRLQNEWAIVNCIREGRRLAVPALEDIPGPAPSKDLLSAYVQLMDRCWAHKISDRPSFEIIVDELVRMKEAMC